jgi:adenylyl cyclase-associated protein
MPGVDDLAALVARLEAVADRLEGGSAGASEDAAASVAAYDEIVSSSYKQFSDLSKKIGGDVATVGAMVDQAFKAQREFLSISSKSKQPGGPALQQLLKPTSDKISEIQAFREKSRRSDFFNHLSAISESIPALGWVAVAPAPSPYVKEMNDAGQFYTNRVLKDWKEKDKTHVDWVKTWVATLTELQAYVKKYYTTGLTWNPKGVEASVKTGGAAPPPPPGPAPPPPPPAGALDLTPDPSKAARGDLLAALNKGADVTKGLKKVSDDQKTHKNPTLRAGAVVKAVDKSPAPAKTYGKAVDVNKPPKLELDGKRWNVEYFKNKPDIEITELEVNQSVYVFKCEGSTVKVDGKCNNIIIDSCKKVAVVFGSVVSSCEFINCQSVQMQVLGKVPTISVEKTDGCQMFLNKESVGAEIVTAKSSEMNVMIPVGDDFVEQPIPEQFKTLIAGGKLKTSATESV